MATSRDVLRRASAEPDRNAIDTPDGVVTFGQLADKARARAEEYENERSELVICGAGDPEAPVEVLADVLAADICQAAAVLLDPDWSVHVRQSAIEAAASATEGTSGASRLVVFTSGTTGVPRPVVRTTTSWTWSFPTFSAYTGVGPDDTVLIPGRLSGSLFLFGALHALTMGATVRLLPRWSPKVLLEAVEACTVVHAVPAMLTALLRTPGKLRLAISAGAHLDAELSDAAATAGIELVDYYGATELSFVAIRRARAPLRPFPGVDVAVREGVLYARSPYLASNIDKDAEGFGTAGDQAVLHDDGSLTIIGRAESAINTGGATVRPEGIEHALRHVEGIVDVAVIGLPHPQLGEVVAAIVEHESGFGTPDDTTPSIAALRELASDRLTSSERPRLWFAIDRLPRTGTGKLDRGQLATGLSDGTLPTRILT